MDRVETRLQCLRNWRVIHAGGILDGLISHFAGVNVEAFEETQIALQRYSPSIFASFNV